jgi:hypothetical protein
VTRRLVALEDVPSGGHYASHRERDPSAPEIASWLDAHPAQLPAVAAAMRKVHVWHAASGVIGLHHPLTSRALGSACHGLDGDARWSWWAGTGTSRGEGSCATKGQAQDEIRRVLRELGWEVP